MKHPFKIQDYALTFEKSIIGATIVARLLVFMYLQRGISVCFKSGTLIDFRSRIR